MLCSLQEITYITIDFILNTLLTSGRIYDSIKYSDYIILSEGVMRVIKNNNNVIFHINTQNTSYVFCANKMNDIQQLYYGNKINYMDSYEAFFEKRNLLLVSSLYNEMDMTYSYEDMCFEMSCPYRGDGKDSSVNSVDVVLCMTLNTLNTP